MKALCNGTEEQITFLLAQDPNKTALLLPSFSIMLSKISIVPTEAALFLHGAARQLVRALQNKAMCTQLLP